MSRVTEIQQECATLLPGTQRSYWLSEPLSPQKTSQIKAAAEAARKDGKTVSLSANGLVLIARIGQ